MKNLVFHVKGMHCPSCEKLIKMDLEELKGIENIKIDHKTGNGSLSFDPNQISSDKIIEVINGTGYEADSTKII